MVQENVHVQICGSNFEGELLQYFLITQLKIKDTTGQEWNKSYITLCGRDVDLEGGRHIGSVTPHGYFPSLK